MSLLLFTAGIIAHPITTKVKVMSHTFNYLGFVMKVKYGKYKHYKLKDVLNLTSPRSYMIRLPPMRDGIPRSAQSAGNGYSLQQCRKKEYLLVQ